MFCVSNLYICCWWTMIFYFRGLCQVPWSPSWRFHHDLQRWPRRSIRTESQSHIPFEFHYNVTTDTWHAQTLFVSVVADHSSEEKDQAKRAGDGCSNVACCSIDRPATYWRRDIRLHRAWHCGCTCTILWPLPALGTRQHEHGIWPELCVLGWLPLELPRRNAWYLFNCWSGGGGSCAWIIVDNVGSEAGIHSEPLSGWLPLSCNLLHACFVDGRLLGSLVLISDINTVYAIINEKIDINIEVCVNIFLAGIYWGLSLLNAVWW